MCLSNSFESGRMMPGELALLFVVLGLGAAFYSWYSARLRRLTRARLDGEMAGSGPPEARLGRLPEFPKRYRAWPPIIGASLAAGIYFLTRLPAPYSLAIGLMTTVALAVTEGLVASRRVGLIESQLADGCDLMVGALRAGAGILAAMEAALVEARQPLRTQLSEVVGRIRLGDEPVEAIQDLARRVPIETFRFFAASFCVHWETGGSMATTLASIGRTIRDRIELSRRVRAQAVESHVSVIGVLAISYVLTFIMWRANPDSVGELLSHPVGSLIAAAAICLQAVGIAWIAAMSRIRS